MINIIYKIQIEDKYIYYCYNDTYRTIYIMNNDNWDTIINAVYINDELKYYDNNNSNILIIDENNKLLFIKYLNYLNNLNVIKDLVEY
jgi:hypothetical protein